VGAIRSRMPVVLRHDEAAAWLSPRSAEARDIIALLQPQRSEESTAQAVSACVGNVRNDEAALIEKLEGPEAIQLPLGVERMVKAPSIRDS